MTQIAISRRHGKTLSDARTAAEHMAAELREEFDLAYQWNGNTMQFKRPGVSGQLSVDDRQVSLDIRLGFLLFAIKPIIEREIHRYFEENFPT